MAIDIEKRVRCFFFVVAIALTFQLFDHFFLQEQYQYRSWLTEME